MNSSTTKIHLPDFLIIGAGKSGTTSLEAYLDQHPEIFLPTRKEPNFFAYEHRRADEFSDLETIEHFNTSVTTYEAYSALFEQAKEEHKVGEISNTYMYMPGSIDNINKYIPEAKFIAILRQPAERLFSRYMHLVRVNKQPEGEFEDLFDKQSIWWERADLINEGYYYRNLKQYFDAFDASRIKVLLHEDLLKQRDETLAEMCRFLGVSDCFEFKSSTFYNQSGVIKNQGLNKLIGNDSVLIKGMKRVSPAIYDKIKSSNFLKDVVEKVRNKNLERKKLSPELKSRISHEIYGEDIANLSKLIDRDLSHWLV